MTQGFDEWFENEDPFFGNDENTDCIWAKRFMRVSYESGQQSRQAEIDELQKRIDEALDMLEGKKGKVLFDDILETLKGKEDE